jgi:hypothetical protein
MLRAEGVRAALGPEPGFRPWWYAAYLRYVAPFLPLKGGVPA